MIYRSAASFCVTDAMLDDALRFMGIPKDARSGDILKEAADTFAGLESVITPRGVYGCFDVSVSDEAVNIAGFEILSRDLSRLLADSERCFFMAVTIGSEADRRILAAQKRGMMNGIMTDACASVRADALCDALEAEIAASLAPGERLTMRFSPGYGDAPLSASADIIRALDASRRIGLFITDAMMMTPVKSVTAIAGVVHGEPRPLPEMRCETCKARGTCVLRRRGERCWS